MWGLGSVMRRFRRGASAAPQPAGADAFERMIHVALLVIVILPMLVLAMLVGWKSGLVLGDEELTDTQLQVFTTFIGGGLATSATLVGILLTYAHNRRAERRLQLETVIKSLENLPVGKARLAGAITTMVLLGHQGVAMRVLQPAWHQGEVDEATATWLIDRVIASEPRDPDAVDEAVTILREHADQLPEKEHRGYVNFPGAFFQRWNPTLSVPSKQNMLWAMGEAVLNRPPEWYFSTPPRWPISIIAECMLEDPDETTRACAAILLDGFVRRFEEELTARLGADTCTKAGGLAKRAALGDATGKLGRNAECGEFLSMADRIKEWGLSADTRKQDGQSVSATPFATA